MANTIAITGATGFAGGHAVAELLKRGHRVRALVRNPATAALPAAATVIQGDLYTDDALNRLLDGADAVVHLAGAVTGLTSHDYFRTNAHGTIAMAEAALRAGTPRFIHVSSLSARQPELSAYGASKRAGEDAIAKLIAPLNALILRPPAVYGPGDRATLPLFRELTHPIAVIPGRAAGRFSLIHAADLARILADAVSSGVTGLHEVSDGKPGGYGWPELIAIAQQARGRPIRPMFLPRAVPHALAAAAEGLARLTGKPGMISRGKVAELYHPDWVARGAGLPLQDAITFDRGFPGTLAWYRGAGWLPRTAGAVTSGAKSNEEAGS